MTLRTRLDRLSSVLGPGQRAQLVLQQLKNGSAPDLSVLMTAPPQQGFELHARLELLRESVAFAAEFLQLQEALVGKLELAVMVHAQNELMATVARTCLGRTRPLGPRAAYPAGARRTPAREQDRLP